MKRKILILLLVALCITCFVSCGLAKSAQESTPRVQEYPVVLVDKYIAARTNPLGAVTGHDLKYCFTFIGSDGQLHTVSDFEHTEYGLWKVCLGEENKYVIKESGLDTYRYLVLTEETMKKL